MWYLYLYTGELSLTHTHARASTDVRVPHPGQENIKPGTSCTRGQGSAHTPSLKGLPQAKYETFWASKKVCDCW